MNQRLYVGDLVRPSASAAADAMKHHVSWYGVQFRSRYPALIVHVQEAERQITGRCHVAFRLKNGRWHQPDNTYRFEQFELIHRPASSALLNPFDVDRPVPQIRHVGVYLAKKYYVVLPHLDGPALVDPDVPIAFGDWPCPPTVLGQAIRSSIASLHGYQHEFADGHFRQPFFDNIEARSTAATDRNRKELSARYKVREEYVLSRADVVSITQLHDCFQLVPYTRGGGYGQSQCREAWTYVALGCTDQELGEAALELLQRPNVKVDHVAKIDPFIGRILPFIDIAAMEADLALWQARNP